MKATQNTVRVVVRGNPAPQGSKKFVGMVNGRGMLVESSKKVKPWRSSVKDAAEAVMVPAGMAPIDAPIHLRIVFTVPAPKSLPKRRVSHPAKTPDLSKLIRSTEDALTEAGVWKDDSRVVVCEAVKTYPSDTLGAHPEALPCPGAVIEVAEFLYHDNTDHAGRNAA